MAKIHEFVGPDQKDLLLRVRKSSPYDIARYLFAVVDGGEKLDPKWKSIWASAKEDARRTDAFPEGLLRRIDEAVALIKSIDDGIRKLKLRPQDQVCLLLGAGASAAAPSSIPTVAHLLPELWRRAGKIGREDIDRLAAWCGSKGVSNIEDLLTAAHLANFAAKNASVTGLLEYFLFRGSGVDETGPAGRFDRPRADRPRVDSSSIALLQDTLQVLFGLLTGTMIPAPPNQGHDAIVNFVRNHPSTSIVTTNYDGCMDEALLNAKVSPNTYIGDAPPSEEVDVDLIKIHGSINWSYCDSCHQVREFPLLEMKETYESDSASYAVIGICKKCGGQRRPLLIPPMGLKFIVFPNLIQLWNIARDRIEAADVIIVVGFSFSEADSYVNKIIERSMTRSSSQKLIVCDSDASLVPTLKRRFTARIDGFDDSRILAAMGPADELLPEFLLPLVRTGDTTGESRKTGDSSSPPDQENPRGQRSKSVKRKVNR